MSELKVVQSSDQVEAQTNPSATITVSLREGATLLKLRKYVLNLDTHLS